MNTALRIIYKYGNCSNGGVAQLGEHLPCKQGVKSSNLSISTLAMSNAKIEGQTRLESLLEKDWMERDFDSAKHVMKQIGDLRIAALRMSLQFNT